MYQGNIYYSYIWYSIITGYIPRMPFKFGNTYKEDCDVCIDEYLSNRNFHDVKSTDLKRQVAGYPRLTSISHDPTVRDQLNLYRDTHPNRSILMGKCKMFINLTYAYREVALYRASFCKKKMQFSNVYPVYTLYLLLSHLNSSGRV